MFSSDFDLNKTFLEWKDTRVSEQERQRTRRKRRKSFYRKEGAQQSLSWGVLTYFFLLPLPLHPPQHSVITSLVGLFGLKNVSCFILFPTSHNINRQSKVHWAIKIYRIPDQSEKLEDETLITKAAKYLRNIHTVDGGWFGKRLIS